MIERFSHHLMSEKVIIRRMSCGFWISRILSAATELDLFGALDNTALSLAEISDKLHIPMRPAKVLLTACTALGLLTKDDGCYSSSKLASTFLVKGKPYYMGYEVMISQRMWDGLGNLKKAILGNSPTVVPRGSDFYEDLEDYELEGFMLTMYSQSFEVVDELLKQIDFSQYSSLLDLGGGMGSVSMAVIQEYPAYPGDCFRSPGDC